MINGFDISQIEDKLKTIVRERGVSNKVYTNRPNATADTADDFVVVKTMGGIYDRGAFGECTISIHLFARDVANIKNATKLSRMQAKFFTDFPAEYEGLMFTNTPTILSDASDGLGYHARIINIKTIIKVQ